MIIKKLRKSVGARRAQLALYREHLRRQYCDRVCYWKARGLSRLREMAGDGSVRKITVIVDSMDHSKFAVPKAVALHSKDFAQFLRPTLSTTCVIIHGYMVLFYMSEPHVAHDSSWTAEVVSHSLHELQGHFPSLDLRQCHLSLHGDNSSKELKNQALMQLCSGLTSQRRLKSASMSFLQSGHSHEDVDQCFSSLSTWISSQPELHTPHQYIQTVQKWLDKASTRPEEQFKKVYKVDQTRAWLLCWQHMIDVHFLLPLACDLN